jgi:hypothetical protein
VILYNVPGRTVADLGNETTLRLAQIPGIVGLKDATGDLARAADLLKRLPSNFAVYSGNDDSALALMLLGGHGVISVTANVAPRLMSEMCAAVLAGDFARARSVNQRLLPLHLKPFVEANPTLAGGHWRKWADRGWDTTHGAVSAAGEPVVRRTKEAGLVSLRRSVKHEGSVVRSRVVSDRRAFAGRLLVDGKLLHAGQGRVRNRAIAAAARSPAGLVAASAG